VSAPQPTLLRMVVGPDRQPAIDVLGKAPGRGVYVCPDLERVRQALSPSGVGRLFRGAADAPSPERAEAMIAEAAARLRGRLQDHLRFARRAGILVWGVSDVLQAEGVVLVIEAEDASARSASRLAEVEVGPAGSVALLRHGTKAELGEILGKSEVAALGLRPSVFVERILWDGERLRRLTNGARWPEGRAEPRSNDSRSHGEETDL